MHAFSEDKSVLLSACRAGGRASTVLAEGES
jgi:hypothetical protein